MTGTGRPSAAADFAQAGDEPRERRQKTAESGNSEPAHSFTEEIERYAAALAGSEGEAYLLGRGFTRETMQRFKLGYDAQRHCVTIPYNPQGSYYGRRSLLPEEKIPEGYYFVGGDNRPVSNDSRYIGLIKEEDILGKTSFVIFPFNRFGNKK